MSEADEAAGENGRAGQGAPGTRATSLVLTGGSLASAACFVVALVLEIMGRTTAGGDVADPAAVLRSLLVPDPWGWATVGVVIVIATPAAALVATVLEYRGQREAWLGLGVLGMLAISVALAVLR